MSSLYTYNAVVISAYDADTVRLDIDLGCGVWLRDESCRLYGINAPEMRGPEKAEGRKARDYLRDLIVSKDVQIETIKDKKGKYGRYLVNINYNGVLVNDLLVTKGYAVYKKY